jgi:hypothetical protein
MHFGLTINYPRLNEFPEWYTVEPTRLYIVTVDGKKLPPMIGDRLIRGLPVEVAGEPVRIVVRPAPGPPYGGRTVRIETPRSFGGDGPFRVPIVVHNDTGERQTIRLTTSFGKIEPAEARLAVAGKIEAVLTGQLTQDTKALIQATTPGGQYKVGREVRLVYEKNLLGFVGFDDQQYKGTPYLWSARRPIEFTLPARRGRDHTLHLLWGAKNDRRGAIVTIDGRQQKITHGGYDGFKWLTVKIESEHITEDTVRIRITPDPENPKAAFISEAKLTSP